MLNDNEKEITYWSVSLKNPNADSPSIQEYQDRTRQILEIVTQDTT